MEHFQYVDAGNMLLELTTRAALNPILKMTNMMAMSLNLIQVNRTFFPNVQYKILLLFYSIFKLSLIYGQSWHRELVL